MANVFFKKGLLANLPASYAAGTFYVTTDERAMYLDIDDSTRIRLGDFIQVEAVANLPTEGASTTALYYCVAENILAKWNGTTWTQINKQPTAEEMKTLLGLGTAAYEDKDAFDAAGAAQAVADYVGTFTASEGIDTVIKYIDAKTANIASDERVTAIDNRVIAIEEDYVKAEDIANFETKENVKKVADDLAGYKTSNDAALAGVKATADAAATKEYTDAELAKKVAKTDYEADKATFATKTELGNVDAKFANYKTAEAQKAIDDEQNRRLGVIEGDYLKAADIANFETKENVKKVADDLDAYVTSNDAAVALKADKSVVDAMYTNDQIDTAVQGAKDYAKGLVDALPEQTDYSVTITETTDGLDTGIAKKYIFTQNGAEIGSINLAKELVVTSGSVKEVTIADMPYAGAVVGDKYIELVIANQDTPIYVPAKDLVDIYTAKDGAAEVQVAISNINEISATLVNKGITEAKLADEITTKLNKTWEEVGVAKGLVDALADGQVKTNKEDIAANAKAISDHEALAAQTYETKEDATAKFNEVKAAVDAIPQADWNQNDETAADYVKNRTHYEDGNRELIATVSCANAYSIGQGHYVVDLPEGFIGNEMVGGGTYQLSIDGLTYDLEDGTYLDNVRFDAPNVVLSDGTSLGRVIIGNSHNYIDFENGYKVSDWSKYTITIYSGAVTIKQLDEKFIPDTIARAVDVKALADGQVKTNTETIALKANTADVYAKTETYNKEEIDAAIEAAHTWGEF